MDLSIVICTHNRADALAETLRALAACARPDGFEIETVVVASACTDHTERVAAEAGVRVTRTTQPGLSRARNAGIDASRGAAILWLDDDVTPDAQFLIAYAAALRAHPTATHFGGPIRPVLAPPSPDWTAAALAHTPTVWSARDFGPSDRSLDPTRNEYPFGANFLVRRSALGQGFRTDLGRHGETWLLLGGEERELCERIVTNGGNGRWVAVAGVGHRIGPERQTLAYVARYFQGAGYQSVVLGSGPSGVTAPRVAVRLVRAGLRFVVWRALGQPSRWVSAYAAMHRGIGVLRAFQVSRKGRAGSWLIAAG